MVVERLKSLLTLVVEVKTYNNLNLSDLVYLLEICVQESGKVLGGQPPLVPPVVTPPLPPPPFRQGRWF